MQASELSADNNLVVLVLFSPDDMASQFSKKNFKILIRLTTEQFSTLPQSILNEPWPRENACASGSCLDMASFLTYRVLAGNGEWHGGLCSPTMFSGSIPEPML